MTFDLRVYHTRRDATETLTDVVGVDAVWTDDLVVTFEDGREEAYDDVEIWEIAASEDTHTDADAHVSISY
ncbi:hypothetical protein [Haladaptatus sp. NG-SE-30]